MRQSVLVALILAAGLAVPAAAQDRLEDRVVVNALMGPGFVGEHAVFNVRATAGVKAAEWLTVAGEWGNLSRPDGQTMIGGQHMNANAFVSTTRPIYRSLRPYGTAGAGAFRVHDGITTATDRSHFATNVGAGVAYDINRWLGVALDYRRFFVDDAPEMPGNDRWTFGVKVGLS